LLSSGCAIITTGTDQGIRVVTKPDVTGANCALIDSKGHTAYVPNTPGTTYITRGDGPLTITCRKTGYKTTSTQIEEGMAGATMGNVILGGGIGIIFDAASGAAQRYPDQVDIWLEPAVWEDEAARQRWLEQKQLYEQEKLTQQKTTPGKTGDDPASDTTP
jgi:hypothetical protein